MAISESLAPSMDLWLMLADPMMMYSSSTEIKQKMLPSSSINGCLSSQAREQFKQEFSRSTFCHRE
jgi:hypothetical protein